MLGWIHEKMATQESTPGGGRFSAFGSIVVGNGASTCNDLCTPGEDCSTAVGNSSWDNAHTFDPSSKGERLGIEPSALVQHAQRTGGSLSG
jgi:hypothetical protein